MSSGSKQNPQELSSQRSTSNETEGYSITVGRRTWKLNLLWPFQQGSPFCSWILRQGFDLCLLWGRTFEVIGREHHYVILACGRRTCSFVGMDPDVYTAEQQRSVSLHVLFIADNAA
jgi:hypothetical protein